MSSINSCAFSLYMSASSARAVTSSSRRFCVMITFCCSELTWRKFSVAATASPIMRWRSLSQRSCAVSSIAR